MNRLVETTRKRLFRTAATYSRGVGAAMTRSTINALPVRKYQRLPKPGATSEVIIIGAQASEKEQFLGSPVPCILRSEHLLKGAGRDPSF